MRINTRYQIKREQKTHNLKDVFFPVKESPFKALINDRFYYCKSKAIIDVERNEILSIVSPSYRLVTNTQAYLQSESIVKELFRDFSISLDDLECFNIRIPKTRSYCHIDFTYEKARFFPVGNNDSWMPFMRITNSYNRTFGLTYNIGLCRAICLNGMIFGEKSIQIKSNHAGDVNNLLLNNSEKIQSIKTITDDFSCKLRILKDYHFPEDKVLALFCKLYNWEVKNLDPEKNKSKIEGFIEKRDDILSRTHAYYRETGSNAYAVLNILSDYATHLDSVNERVVNLHSRQSRTASWADEFVFEIQKEDFSLDKYLSQDALKNAEIIQNLNI